MTALLFFASAMDSTAMEILSLPQSPPQNTPGRLVRKVFLSYTTPPLRVSSRPGRPAVSTFWPIARMTVSTARVSVLPSTGLGARRPEASGSPSCITWRTISLTRPSGPALISSGLVRFLKMTPSSSASSISRRSAGISSLVRR